MKVLQTFALPLGHGTECSVAGDITSPLAPQSVAQTLLLLHTIVPKQVTPQLPQLLLLDMTHMPLQLRSPVPHVHAPA